MSVLNENQKMGASGAGGEFEIEQSLRFDKSSTPYLNRTFAAVGNRKTWTFSAWIKRAGLTDGTKTIFSSYAANNDAGYFDISFLAADTIAVHTWGTTFRVSNQLFRDTSAWYHVVLAVDTTQGTASNRLKVYVNGDEITSWSTNNAPSQNFDTAINNDKIHSVGALSSTAAFVDGYMGEVNFIDGQALTPSSFGETGKYGEWKPIEVDGITYGTNGFYLPFKQDYTVEGFSTVVYGGNGASSHYIGGVGFKPDFLWIKRRDATGSNSLFDAIRGDSKGLHSDSTTAQWTDTGVQKEFNTDGFTTGNHQYSNHASGSYVAWNWDMGGTTASNTSGTINSSVRANQAYGQSIVTYSANGSSGTIGHGLGAVPTMIVVKKRNAAERWCVFHTATSNAYLYLNENFTAETGNADDRFGNNTSVVQPTSSVFTVGQSNDVNGSSGTYVAYCFSDIAGYSKFSSYEGTGGTHAITLGFSPAFVMIKNADAVAQWTMWDNTRNPTNPVTQMLRANTDGVENTKTDREPSFTATGFTIGDSDADTNASGQTYVYMAFADTREYAYWLDQSGNNNDWESEGGLTESDVMVDSPTNNFATLNPLWKGSAVTLSEGNCKATITNYSSSSSGTQHVSSGKIYFEVLPTTQSGANDPFFIGVCKDNRNPTTDPFSDTGVYGYYGINGNKRNNSNLAYGDVYTIGDVIGVALDLDAGTLTFYNNNVSQGIAFSGLSGSFSCFVGSGSGAYTIAEIANFGSDSSFAGNKTPQGNQDSNGIGDFYYAPPTGFLALCTANLPSVDVIPSENFNTVLYTGNATARSITVDMTPDFTWIKKRNTAANHAMFDTVRGATKGVYSNLTNAEFTNSDTLTSFNADGYSVGSHALVNGSNQTFVAWNWKAGGATPSKTYAVTVVSDSGNKYRFDGFGTSAVTINLQEGGTYKFDQSHSSNSGHPFRFGTSSNAYNYSTGVTTSGTPGNAGAYTQITLAANAPALYYSCSSHSGMGGAVNTNATFGSSNFSGSITSSVSANVDAGFSIVTYTGSGSAGTVGTGLSQRADLIITKGRSNGGNGVTWHKDLPSAFASNGGYAYLNSTGAAGATTVFYDGTGFTSSVFKWRGGNENVNQSSRTYLSYCFHSVDGYSKVGSYTGNGSADGTFVYTGFRPAYVMYKRTENAENWEIIDNARETTNQMGNILKANTSDAEGIGATALDFLSNGFKARTAASRLNASGGTYIYLAFAESPFKNSNAR